jgi:hypothetical protein
MRKTDTAVRAILSVAVLVTVAGEMWVFAIPLAIALWVSLVAVEP